MAPLSKLLRVYKMLNFISERKKKRLIAVYNSREVCDLINKASLFSGSRWLVNNTYNITLNIASVNVTQ